MVVVGGGVAGLNVARRLTAAGVAFALVEARDRLGGRVLTVDDGTSAYDLGPSWFWPQVQPALGALVSELGLTSSPQRSDGDVVFERMSREPAQRCTPVEPVSGSMRLDGGATTLVRALARDLPPDAVHLGTCVTGLALLDDGVRVHHRDAAGDGSTDARHVVVALPPRLLEASVALDPAPTRETAELWRGTPTWMAAQAKFFALYDTPFWVEDGLSGTVQSLVGPLLEIHDATTRSGGAALMGFLGVGPADRQALGEQALTEACVGQLARVFGPRARSPRSTILHDWATEPLTSTAADLVSGGHPVPAPVWVDGPWADTLLLAGSEVSPSEGGYLAGAVEASTRAADEVCRRLGTGGRRA